MIAGNNLLRGQTEIGELDRVSVVRYQDVFRLEIPMINPNGVTMLNGIQNLQESMFGKTVVSNEMAVFGDIREQISFRAELDHNEGAIRAVENADQRNHVLVLTGLVMQSDFSSLDPSLACVQAGFGKGFHGVGDVG